MININILRFFIAIAFIFSILTYHLMIGIFPTSNLYGIDTAIKIAQIMISGIIFWLILSNKLLLKLYFGESYIKGKYKAISTPIIENNIQEKKLARKNDIDLTQSNIQFSIEQTIFGTEISGVSHHLDDGSLRSTWTGRAFKIERNKFYFGLELSRKTVGYAVLVITFNENNITGFYYPAKLDYSYVVKFEGEKTDG